MASSAPFPGSALASDSDATSSASSLAADTLTSPPASVTLRNAATGTSVPVPSSVFAGRSLPELRRRIRDAEPLLPGAPLAVDWDRRTYRPAHHPSLSHIFLPFKRWYFIPIGALLIAACSQIKFFFPCLGDTVGVGGPAGTSYCVPPARVPGPGLPFLPSQCPADVCAKRIPVTMQTWAVLLNGAIAGRFGWAATAFYVLLVCLGAPFGSNGKYDPVWEKGAIVGSNGGYFAGFIVASLIMGLCSEKGHDRPRSSYYLVPWMLLAELVMYACGLFWLPFGMAIARGVSPAAICPAEAGAGPCLKNIFTWGFVPFIPGELVKMLLVLVAVPGLWSLALLWHRWRAARRARDGIVEEDDEVPAAAAFAETAAVAPAPVISEGQKAVLVGGGVDTGGRAVGGDDSPFLLRLPPSSSPPLVADPGAAPSPAAAAV